MTLRPFLLPLPLPYHTTTKLASAIMPTFGCQKYLANWRISEHLCLLEVVFCLTPLKVDIMIVDKDNRQGDTTWTKSRF